MALQMKKIWLSSLAVVGLGLGLAAAVPALAQVVPQVLVLQVLVRR
ncbi:hypothetical protein L3X07_09675 [Levilactobacillus brevis]|nr:hypothetical protein [Levilactobacillus brevis]